MRLEQLVLYGAGVDDRLRFGSHVTVFAGLGAPDRIELIETIVDALTGRLSNASVVFTDRDGRRIFADRTGATFADTGLSAPGPAVLLGRDPSAVAGMLTLTAADLGLGLDQTVAHVTHQLESAREALAGYHTEHVQALELADALDRGRRHLAALDAQLATTEDDRARWRWQQNRNKLDELRAELAIARRSSGASAQKILASVDALRAAGSEWADLAASVTELQDRMRPLPQVSSEDLARVAATPDQPPTTFLARLDAWRAAQEAVRAAEAELTEVSRPHPRNTDPLVEAFARLDQTRLWAAHARLTQAAQAYHGVSAAAEEEFPEDTDAERGGARPPRGRTGPAPGRPKGSAGGHRRCGPRRGQHPRRRQRAVVPHCGFTRRRRRPDPLAGYRPSPGPGCRRGPGGGSSGQKGRDVVAGHAPASTRRCRQRDRTDPLREGRQQLGDRPGQVGGGRRRPVGR